MFTPAYQLVKLDCKFIASERDFIGENILVSSENNNKFTEESRTVGKSFLNKLNKRGSKLELCGTPEHTLKKF